MSIKTNEKARCAHCGKPATGASSADGPLVPPSEGDVGICLYCAGINVYKPDLTMTKLTEEMEAQLKADDSWKVVEQARNSVLSFLGGQRASIN